MNNIIFINLRRFLGLLLFQGLILHRMELNGGAWDYIHILGYPLFIFLLPLRTPRAAVVGSAFLMGILVDLFYYTPGLHASASTFLGFIRPTVQNLMKPREGYTVTYSPTKAQFGAKWFYRYAAVLLALHLFFYFSAEAFTFVYIGRILLNTGASFIVSFVFVLIYMRIFNPRE